MYAIAFDLDQDNLSKTYGSVHYTNAYNDIKNNLMPAIIVFHQQS